MGSTSNDGARAYTLKQAFERLAISHVTGHKLVGTGQLASYKVGRRRYVTDEALRRFIQARVSEAT